MWKYFFKHKKQEHLSSLNQASFTEGWREELLQQKEKFWWATNLARAWTTEFASFFTQI